MASLPSIPSELFAEISAQCDRQTLLALALSCRALSWLSLAMLWRELDSVSPLLYTLPSDAITRFKSHLEGRNISKPHRIIDVIRELTSADLVRYRLYAPFVHRLRVSVLNQWYGREVTDDGWRYFARANPGPLPNLRRLDASLHLDSESSMMTPIHLLLGSAFEGLTVLIRISRDSDPIRTLKPSLSDLLVSLPLQCPQFARLHLHQGRPAAYMSDALADALCGLRHLVDVRTDVPLLPRAFAHLRSVPTLTTLFVHACAADYPTGALTDDRSETQPFAALSTLTITSDSTECVTSVIEYAHPPRLEYIHVTASGQPTSREMMALSATMGSLPARATLERLYVDVPRSPCSLTPPFFEPLYAIPHLRVLVLKGSCYASLDNAEFMRMARAWPHMEYLQLCHFRPPPGTITLAGLVESVRVCRSLTSLRLRLADISHSECAGLLARIKRLGLGARPPGLPPTPRLLRLGIGSPSVDGEDVDAVAEILAMALPPLYSSLIHSWGPQVSGYRVMPAVLPPPASRREVMARRWAAVRERYNARLAEVSR
ncbi:hypothetical protein FKP32DRAFT_1639466 [Trametes sanguinea]|nr:hypothetical protein FKP32DRAFT_1639466 [Trametes sanguinea]